MPNPHTFTGDPEKVILLGWFLVIKVLDWFKVTTYGAAASDGGCSLFFCLENALECKMLKLQAA